MKSLSAMRKLLALFMSLMLVMPLMAQEDKDLPARPSPPHLVNDLGDVLVPTQEALLEQKLVAYNDSTSTQIAVVTVQTVKPYAIADYAYRLGRKWGVGHADKDNGIVILVAVVDHQIFIATGYGTEGFLPDIATSHIINDIMVPSFRKDDYYGGIDGGVDEMYKYLMGAYEGNPYGSGSEDGMPWWVILIIIFIILIIMSRNNRKGGGTTFSRRGPTYWGGGGFGGFGGGGFGGGGGGGGFGGFGGGSFGGGGAGGSW